MSTQLFALDTHAKTLSPLTPHDMHSLGASEPYDLETWLASTGRRLFNRSILWIARQDRPTQDQRSDLVGLDADGNLLVAELKRGGLDESGVTQALAYAAEYARLGAGELVELFAECSSNQGSTGLLVRAESDDDAQAKVRDHCGLETELNEAQILLLVAEDFSARSLAICDYLNNASGDASYSVECWRYSVFSEETRHYFVLEQILPPPSVRETIEQKREAAKERRYVRDPVRKQFMHALMGYVWGHGAVIAGSRSRGQSYGCKLHNPSWPEGVDVDFSLWQGNPQLLISADLRIDVPPPDANVTIEADSSGRTTVTFQGTQCSVDSFTDEFAERLVAVINSISVAQPPGGEA